MDIDRERIQVAEITARLSRVHATVLTPVVANTVWEAHDRFVDFVPALIERWGGPTA